MIDTLKFHVKLFHNKHIQQQLTADVSGKVVAVKSNQHTMFAAEI